MLAQRLFYRLYLRRYYDKVSQLQLEWSAARVKETLCEARFTAILFYLEHVFCSMEIGLVTIVYLF
jgi:hypothetical protein